MIEKVVSATLTIIVVLFLSVFLYTSVFRGVANEGELLRQQYEQEYSVGMIRSLFLANEESSGLTYEGLLIRALREVSTTLVLDGETVDVEAEFADALDALVGNGNYHFEVEPILKGVVISYILDGSPTMAPKRAQVNLALPGLMQSLRDDVFGPDAVIVGRIFILADPAKNLCDGFTLPPEVSCVSLSAPMLYPPLQQRGFRPGIPAPYRSYKEFEYSTHESTPNDLAESDWAAAVAYAHYNVSDDPYLSGVTNKHVIVTVADELTTSSKADACFSLQVGADYLICIPCDDDCPEERAQRVINQTRDILLGSDDLFIGFTSFVCDYDYPDVMTGFGVTEYMCGFADPPPNDACRNAGTNGTLGPAGDINWCDQDACGGCAPTLTTPSDGLYCFHRNCDALIQEDMEELAAASGGVVLDLTDLSQLTDEVYAYFVGQVEEFNFTIGVKDPSRERYVVEESVTLMDGERIALRFWLYE